eukprot:3647851-Amphidinium_carterae.1
MPSVCALNTTMLQCNIAQVLQWPKGKRVLIHTRNNGSGLRAFSFKGFRGSRKTLTICLSAECPDSLRAAQRRGHRARPSRGYAQIINRVDVD